MIPVPQAAIELAKRFEGFHRVPKHDPNRAYPYICLLYTSDAADECCGV